MEGKDLGKTGIGIAPNIAGLLAYLCGFITGIVFYVIEKENKFVRFHALQSIIVFGGLFIINIAVNIIIPFGIGAVLSLLTGLLGLILWIILMIKAYQGEMYKIPVAGDMAESKI